MHLVIISGMSGAGKSYALHTLEDNGYYCIDNLPSQLLEALLSTPQIAKQPYLAVGIDIRGGRDSLLDTPDIIKRVRQRVPSTQVIYLYATQEVLRKRYNETRRRHPLTSEAQELDKAIALESTLLEPLAIDADLRLDTSHIGVYELGRMLTARISQTDQQHLSLMIQSFGFKHTAPSDSDFLFDVRCLPNPYWEPDLRTLTGRDAGIIEWLEKHEDVQRMYHDLRAFLDNWIPNIDKANQRAYLTVSIGCTGGRHRSVYLAEQLYKHFRKTLGENVILRHRELNYVR
ncbi:RNase adapter RapZ [Thiothrix litoralis]|uniref:RNase adapter RapZ n=1 Tax=Thiothrix litoralis TaxID=2891210 RepID=A0ABX7WZR0_9GAMM|nr:RNase adapter RapZ [Thiothrix litoralis]QTR47998.1 RNase adapter RapZ [Thiothrix litoralis]